MLGNKSMKFESPNAIDAGDAPPTRPGRARHHHHGIAATTYSPTRGRLSPRTVREIVKGERLFRGIKLNIEGDDGSQHSSSQYSSNDGSNSSNSNNPKIDIHRRTGTFGGGDGENNTNGRCDDELDGSLMMEFYDGDEESLASHTSGKKNIPSTPSLDDARLYATSLLNNSLISNNNDEENAFVGNDGSYDEEDEVRPLSSAPLNTWRRPSRRKQHLRQQRAMAEAAASHDNGEKRRSCRYLLTMIGCSVILLGAAVAFFVLVTMAATKKNHNNNNNNNNNSAVVVETGSDVTSEMVSSPRYLKTIDWLEEHGISDIKSLTTAGTPQFQAAVWMADTDKERLEIPVTTDSSNSAAVSTNINMTKLEQYQAHHDHKVEYERFLQRYILAVLFFEWEGSEWKHDLNFLSPSHECGWFHSEKGTDGHYYAVGVSCNDDLLVQDIFIPNNNLVGSIPTEIQFFQHLELLSLRHNFITSTIPFHLSHLASTLEYLDFSKNAISGTIPSEFGRLKKLRALGLTSNKLEGSLPSQLGDLTDMRTLDLEENGFTGNVKTVLANLTKLEYLYLGSNGFEDMLDDSFLVDLGELKELTLNENKFVSLVQLPENLFLSHPHMTLLDLSDNFLGGTLPRTFTVGSSLQSNQLQFLSLHSNQLTGSVPLAIQDLKNLQYLDLSQNKFAGTVPVSVGNMKSSTHIFLGYNNFEPGPIPPALFTITNLQQLSMPETHLTGEIPPWFSLLSRLEYLDLRANELIGTIPDTMWGMHLSTMLLSHNMLNSTLPRTFPESQLEILALDNNAIIGNATGLCASAPNLATFVYGCDQVTCTGRCCHSACCRANVADNGAECFATLLSSSLEFKEGEDFHGYRANRTIYSLSPSIILHESV